jgi:hypothetical protein
MEDWRLHIVTNILGGRVIFYCPVEVWIWEMVGKRNEVEEEIIQIG